MAENKKKFKKRTKKKTPATDLTVAITVALDRTQAMHLHKLYVNVTAFMLTLKQNRIIL